MITKKNERAGREMAERLDREHELWISVRDQGKAIIALEANQESISKSLGQITETLKHLTAEVANSHRTQWPVIFGAMGMVTTILLFVGGIVAYAWMSDITYVGERSELATKNINEQIDTLADQFHEHERAKGHPDAVIKQVEELSKRFTSANMRLNERLNRHQDQLDYLQRRTGTLFKEGKPY